MEEVSGKVAVVTGGASGIGLAMATRFAQEGMKVLLADIEGMCYEEIAETMNCSLGTVRSRLHRGRKQLRSRLTSAARCKAEDSGQNHLRVSRLFSGD